MIKLNQCQVTARMAMKSVVHRIAITRARINLGQVVRRAHLNREYFILEKDGIPVAGIMNVDEFEDYLELQNPGLKRRIQKGHAEYKRGKARDARTFLSGVRRASAKPKK
jgi:PHD/YefM family antitoxin component YafN of YafNO toxin-antitoxin module